MADGLELPVVREAFETALELVRGKLRSYLTELRSSLLEFVNHSSATAAALTRPINRQAVAESLNKSTILFRDIFSLAILRDSLLRADDEADAGHGIEDVFFLAVRALVDTAKALQANVVTSSAAVVMPVAPQAGSPAAAAAADNDSSGNSRGDGAVLALSTGSALSPDHLAVRVCVGAYARCRGLLEVFRPMLHDNAEYMLVADCVQDACDALQRVWSRLRHAFDEASTQHRSVESLITSLVGMQVFVQILTEAHSPGESDAGGGGAFLARSNDESDICSEVEVLQDEVDQQSDDDDGGNASKGKQQQRQQQQQQQPTVAPVPTLNAITAAESAEQKVAALASLEKNLADRHAEVMARFQSNAYYDRMVACLQPHQSPQETPSSLAAAVHAGAQAAIDSVWNAANELAQWFDRLQSFVAARSPESARQLGLEWHGYCDPALLNKMASDCTAAVVDGLTQLAAAAARHLQDDDDDDEPDEEEEGRLGGTNGAGQERPAHDMLRLALLYYAVLELDTVGIRMAQGHVATASPASQVFEVVGRSLQTLHEKFRQQSRRVQRGLTTAQSQATYAALASTLRQMWWLTAALQVNAVEQISPWGFVQRSRKLLLLLLLLSPSPLRLLLLPAVVVVSALPLPLLLALQSAPQ